MSSYPSSTEVPDDAATLAILMVMYSAALVRAIEEHDLSLSVYTFGQDVMTPQGVLTLTAVGSDDRAAFFYLGGNVESAAHFAGAQKLLSSLGKPEPVYYSPTPLPESEVVGNPCRPLGLDNLHFEEGAAPDGTYATWWRADEEKFLESHTAIAFKKLLKQPSYMHEYLGAKLKKEADSQENVIPIVGYENDYAYYVKGPDSRAFIVSYSKYRGIQFSFPIDSTPADYRDAVIGSFADYVESEVKNVCEMTNDDEFMHDSRKCSPDWWDMLEQNVSSGFGLTQLGVYIVGHESNEEQDDYAPRFDLIGKDKDGKKVVYHICISEEQFMEDLGVSEEDGDETTKVSEFIESIPEIAEGNVETARKMLGISLDYSPESIFQIDSLIQKCWPNGPPVMLNNMVVTWGSYLGESIRRNHGGEWGYTEESNFYLKVGRNKVMTLPFAAINKRFQNGGSDSISDYYNKLVSEIGD